MRKLIRQMVSFRLAATRKEVSPALTPEYSPCRLNPVCRVMRHDLADAVGLDDRYYLTCVYHCMGFI